MCEPRQVSQVSGFCKHICALGSYSRPRLTRSRCTNEIDVQSWQRPQTRRAGPERFPRGPGTWRPAGTRHPLSCFLWNSLFKVTE